VLVVLLRVLRKEAATRMGRLKTKEGQKPTAIPFLPSAAMPCETAANYLLWLFIYLFVIIHILFRRNQ
jgi:hypothetical protein